MIDQTTTKKTKDKLNFSFVLLCIITIIGICSPAHAQALVTPSIFPATGSKTTSQTVTLYAPSGSIYYTTDGSIPTTSSTLYTAPITLISSTQINAITYQSGSYSAVTTGFFDIDPALAPLLQYGLILRLSNFGIVTQMGSPRSVLQWTDLSGSANNAIGVAGSQPVLGNSATGTSGISFNGTSQFLQLPKGFIYGPSGLSIFLVVRPNTPSAGARFIDLGNGAASNNIYMSQPSTSAVDFHIYNGSTDSSVTSSTALNIGQFQLLEGFYNGTNTGTLYTNGQQDAQNTSMQAANYVARTNNFIGQASGGGNYYSGNIAEILVYAIQLSASQRAAIESYFIQKYQLLSVIPRTPIISVTGGTLSGSTQVAITSQPDTLIYYTTDGTTPTTNSTVYSGCPIIVNYSQTLKAIAVKNKISSSVASAAYTLDSTQWPAPSPSDITAPVINLQLPVPSL